MTFPYREQRDDDSPRDSMQIQCRMVWLKWTIALESNHNKPLGNVSTSLESVISLLSSSKNEKANKCRG